MTKRALIIALVSAALLYGAVIYGSEEIKGSLTADTTLEVKGAATLDSTTNLKAGTVATTINYCADANGSGTTYTCSLAVAPAAYTTGMKVTFVPGTASSGAPTLNINSLGAISIVWTDGSTALGNKDLIAGGIYTLEYDGTHFRNVNGPDDPWIGFAYSNSWADFGSGLIPGQYRKMRNGEVCFHGVLSEGTTTAGTTIATLPAGYRPTSDYGFIGVNNVTTTETPHQIRIAAATGIMSNTFVAVSNYMVIPEYCYPTF